MEKRQSIRKQVNEDNDPHNTGPADLDVVRNADSGAFCRPPELETGPGDDDARSSWRTTEVKEG